MAEKKPTKRKAPAKKAPAKKRSAASLAMEAAETAVDSVKAPDLELEPKIERVKGVIMDPNFGKCTKDRCPRCNQDSSLTVHTNKQTGIHSCECGVCGAEWVAGE